MYTFMKTEFIHKLRLTAVMCKVKGIFQQTNQGDKNEKNKTGMQWPDNTFSVSLSWEISIKRWVTREVKNYGQRSRYDVLTFISTLSNV